MHTGQRLDVLGHMHRRTFGFSIEIQENVDITALGAVRIQMRAKNGQELDGELSLELGPRPAVSLSSEDRAGRTWVQLPLRWRVSSPGRG